MRYSDCNTSRLPEILQFEEFSFSAFLYIEDGFERGVFVGRPEDEEAVIVVDGTTRRRRLRWQPERRDAGDFQRADGKTINSHELSIHQPCNQSIHNQITSCLFYFKNLEPRQIFPRQAS